MNQPRTTIVTTGTGPIAVDVTTFVDPPKSMAIFCHGLGSFSANSFALAAEKMLEERRLVDGSTRFSFHEHFDGVTDLRSFSFNRAREELLSVVGWVREQGVPEISVIASSFGAQIVLAAVADGLLVDRVFLRAALADCMRHRMSATPSEEVGPWKDRGWFEFPVAGRLAQLSVRLMEELHHTGNTISYAKIPVTIPITFIHGSADQTIPCEVTRAAASQISHAYFHEIAEADHSFTNPQHQQELFDTIARRWR